MPSRIFQRVEILSVLLGPPAPYKVIDLFQDLKRKRKDLTGTTSNLKAKDKPGSPAHSFSDISWGLSVGLDPAVLELRAASSTLLPFVSQGGFGVCV